MIDALVKILTKDIKQRSKSNLIETALRYTVEDSQDTDSSIVFKKENE